MKKKIGIIGYGYVGKAFSAMVKDFYEVYIYDPNPEYQHFSSEDREKINTCDLAVVCVPTPSNPDGSCDISIVEDVISWLKTDLVLIKSTIAPGTTDYLSEKYGRDIVFSPEYVGEGKYQVSSRLDFQSDMKKTPFLILGGPELDAERILDLLVPILGPEKTYYTCRAIEAEIIKYMENTYFAAKITFAQEMYDICQQMDASWYKVWQGWALDPRVDIMHTAVFPENRGFGGKCLPKDVNALVKASIDKGYFPKMLMAILESNATRRDDEPVRVQIKNQE